MANLVRKRRNERAIFQAIKSVSIFATIGVMSSVPASGQSAKEADSSLPTEINALLNCQTIEQPDKRLACYDEAVQTLAKAEDSGDLLFASREGAEQAEREVFGLTAPPTTVFAKNDEKIEPIEKITAKIGSVQERSNGRYVFTLDTGARWAQSEDVVGRQRYQEGDTIEIKRAAFGSFRAKVNGRRSFRVKRLN